MKPLRTALAAVLLALVALYMLWFRGTGVALVAFAFPPALLALLLWLDRRGAVLAAGMLALAWFAHAVMVICTRPLEQMFAWIELLLALIAVGLASFPGWQARVRARQRR